MKRIFTLFALAFFFVACFSSAPRAQESVAVRITPKQDFTRLAFDLIKGATYKVDDKTSGKVILRLDKAGKLDLGKADFSSLTGIGAPKILSENPLAVEISIPAGTKVRSFDAKGKVFLDIYGVKKDQTDVVQKPETKKIAIKLEPEDTPEIKPVAKAAVKPEAKPAPPVDVAKPEILKAPEQEKLEKIKNTQNKPLSITMTATQAVSVAVYLNFNQLWFTVNEDSFSLKPKVNGDLDKIMGAFEHITVSGGAAYRTIMAQDLPLKSRGGGLLWEVFAGKDLHEPKGTTFEKIKIESDLNALLWPVTETGAILDVPDPLTGQGLKVVTVKSAQYFAGDARTYVDFDVLRAPIGLVIRPKVDDLTVTKTGEGIVISRPGGLKISPDDPAMALSSMAGDKPVVDLHAQAEGKSSESATTKSPSIFHFRDWKIGSLADLSKNETILLSNLQEKSEPQRIEDLMMLAKMNLAHGHGTEALGLMEYAQTQMPELLDSPEFLALRGVSRAFSWKSEIALNDLSHPDLVQYDEVKSWKAFVLADLGDWKQAAESLPHDYSYLEDYPEFVANRLALSLAEVNLRAGKIKEAEALLALINKHESAKHEPLRSGILYLQGEVHRQKGEKEKTIEIWEKLASGADDFYRVRAGLALARLLKEDKKIDNKEVIDRLERLRYAWRGDELEAQTNYWLGRAYFESGEFIKGLTIMRDAAKIAADTALGKRIVEEMRAAYRDIFLKNRLKDVTPLDAVAMYDQFSELMPAGEEGNKLTQLLADRLITEDLLARAEKLLQHQVDHRLQGEEKVKVAIRLAALYLTDKQPKDAIRALRAAVQTMDGLPDDTLKVLHTREITLLSAKAYAQAGKGDQALALLKDMPNDQDVSRLRGDIAWQSGYWADAAEALNEVLLSENITKARPITDAQADMIMNRAIALNLANDRVSLGNMRAAYNDAMLQTPRANQFDLITRPRRDSELADKETLLSIMSEVDLFKTFLDNYRGQEAK